MVANINRTTITGVSSTGGFMVPFFPDISRTPFQVSVGVVLNSTTQILTVEHSFDYPGPNSSTWVSSAATWFASTGIAAFAGSSTVAGSQTQTRYDFPVTALRLQSSAGSSAGTATVTFVQSG